MSKLKPAYLFVLAVVFVAASLVACNNSSENKEATTDTTQKMEQTTQPKMDTSASKMMDTSGAKMDTAATRPVKEGN